MPQIQVTEPHARPPRIPDVGPTARWLGPLETDRGWAELEGVVVGGDAELALEHCQQLEISGSVLEGVRLGPGPTIEVRQSRLVDCDLSGARLTSMRGARLEGCKLDGTDLSDARLTEVILERCRLRFTNLRMARMERVAIEGCALDDVDAFDLQATDVGFDGTSLRAVNVDRLQATRVDLRGATELGLAAVGRLDGCLVADHQLPALAPLLALAVGLDLERPSESERP